jgi:hypothetical protein
LLKLIFFGFVTVEHVIPNLPSKLVSPLFAHWRIFLQIERKGNEPPLDMAIQVLNYTLA